MQPMYVCMYVCVNSYGISNYCTYLGIDERLAWWAINYVTLFEDNLGKNNYNLKIGKNITYLKSLSL